MKITIKDKNSVKDYKPEGKAIIIRIEDVYPIKDLKYGDLYLEEKRFFFLDIDYDMDYSITEQEMIEIYNFVNNYKNKIDEIVVQCVYGQGRSPAVAFAIAKLFNFEEPLGEFPDRNNFILDKFLNYFKS